eukprot:1037321-Prymnesium_polylepis.1
MGERRAERPEDSRAQEAKAHNVPIDGRRVPVLLEERDGPKRSQREVAREVYAVARVNKRVRREPVGQLVGVDECKGCLRFLVALGDGCQLGGRGVSPAAVTYDPRR